MNSEVLQKIAKVLDMFEIKTKHDTRVENVSEGFAHADMTGFDAEYIDIRLRWGAQSDCADTVNEEQYKLLVYCLNKENIDEIVEDIQEA